MSKPWHGRVTLPEAELGFEISVVSCEDLIVLKLIAGRILDRVDVAELMKGNRYTLDFSYLESWVRKVKLVHAFHEAWKDAFPAVSPPF